MPAAFRFDRTWRFDASVADVWDALSDTAAYPTWWSWLDRYEAGPLAVGTVATFRVRPPLPYSLSFVVHVDEVDPHACVRATVSGDVHGPARLELAPTATGCTARLSWELVLADARLRRVERVARPIMMLGHDVVVALGVRQFRRALRRRV